MNFDRLFDRYDRGLLSRRQLAQGIRRMSNTVWFVAGIVTAVVSIGATTWVQAQQQRRPGSQTLLSPEDYMEIEQLYGMYARDVDPGSVRNASWMFTGDGVSEIGPRRSGQEMKDFYAQVQKDQNNGVRHFNSSYVIVGTPEGARGSVYMMQVERNAQGQPAQIALFGKYEDRLVKTRDGWRIKERIWKSDSFRGSTAPVSPSPVAGDR
jgi:hypothetical protein